MPLPEARNDTRDGFIAALICYLIWGLLPIYFVFVSAVAPTEVLLHRIVWAVPFGCKQFKKQGVIPQEYYEILQNEEIQS